MIETALTEFYRKVREMFPEAKRIYAEISTQDGPDIRWSATAYLNSLNSSDILGATHVKPSAEAAIEDLALQREMNPIKVNDPEEVMG